MSTEEHVQHAAAWRQRACVCVCVCVYVCVQERERESVCIRESERLREITLRRCFCVCVCVREWKRETKQNWARPRGARGARTARCFRYTEEESVSVLTQSVKMQDCFGGNVFDWSESFFVKNLVRTKSTSVSDPSIGLVRGVRNAPDRTGRPDGLVPVSSFPGFRDIVRRTISSIRWTTLLDIRGRFWTCPERDKIPYFLGRGRDTTLPKRRKSRDLCLFTISCFLLTRIHSEHVIFV